MKHLNSNKPLHIMRRLLATVLGVMLAILSSPAVSARATEAMQEAASLEQMKRGLETLLLEPDDMPFTLKNKEKKLGDWRIHPKGFAYYLPGGMQTADNPGKSDVSLREISPQKRNFYTNITVTVTEEDAGILTMTPDKANAAFMGHFRNYELLSFKKESMYGEDGVCLVSVWNDRPRVLMIQRMFNKNGHCYVLTLMVENEIDLVCEGLAQYGAFCDSLLFFEPER